MPEVCARRCGLAFLVVALVMRSDDCLLCCLSCLNCALPVQSCCFFFFLFLSHSYQPLFCPFPLSHRPDLPIRKDKEKFSPWSGLLVSAISVLIAQTLAFNSPIDPFFQATFAAQRHPGRALPQDLPSPSHFFFLFSFAGQEETDAQKSENQKSTQPCGPRLCVAHLAGPVGPHSYPCTRAAAHCAATHTPYPLSGCLFLCGSLKPGAEGLTWPLCFI